MPKTASPVSQARDSYESVGQRIELSYAERIRRLGRCRDVIIRAKIKLPQNDLRRKSPTKLSWMDYSLESTAAA